MEDDKNISPVKEIPALDEFNFQSLPKCADFNSNSQGERTPHLMGDTSFGIDRNTGHFRGDRNQRGPTFGGAMFERATLGRKDTNDSSKLDQQRPGGSLGAQTDQNSSVSPSSNNEQCRVANDTFEISLNNVQEKESSLDKLTENAAYRLVCKQKEKLDSKQSHNPRTPDI